MVTASSDAGWVLLTYRVPREPSAARVSIWRKLKAAGALLLHDAVWVLPLTARTRETFQWLADETRQRGGQATVWTARPMLEADATALERAFAARADDAYRAVLRRLTRAGASARAVAAEYQRARDIDFFRSEWGERARDALLAGPRRARRGEAKRP